MADPYDEFEYEVTPVEVTKEKPEDSENSPVKGVFRKIEDAEREASGVHPNHTIMFAGLICPIIREEEDCVWIIHGNTELKIPKTEARKVLNTRQREGKSKWEETYKSPLLPPHRR